MAKIVPTSFCLRSSSVGGEPDPVPQEPLSLGDHLLEVLIRNPGDPETDVGYFSRAAAVVDHPLVRVGVGWIVRRIVQ